MLWLLGISTWLFGIGVFCGLFTDKYFETPQPCPHCSTKYNDGRINKQVCAIGWPLSLLVIGGHQLGLVVRFGVEKKIESRELTRVAGENQ